MSVLSAIKQPAATRLKQFLAPCNVAAATFASIWCYWRVCCGCRISILEYFVNFRLLVLVLVTTVLLQAQENVRHWWGIIAGWSLLDHHAGMPVYEGQPECGRFTRGRSSGFLAGISYDRRLLGWVEATGRLTLWQRPARLELVTDNGLEAYDPEQNQYVPFLRRHIWQASLWYLGVEVGARLYPLQLLQVHAPLWLRLGVDVAYPAFGADYEQTEEILQPRALLFPDGTRRHTIARGPIADVATAFGVLAALGGTIPLRPRMALLPEIGLRYGVNSLRSSQQWTVHTGFVAVGLRLDLSAPPVVQPQPVVSPPPPPSPPPLILSLDLPEPVRIQEAVVTETFPLLPYVFFDSASSDLPVRYLPLIEDASFSDTALPHSTMTIYYHLLHILGKRLTEDSTAVIVITGTTDGREVPPSLQPALARGRAEAIAAYLRSRWHVRPHQIRVTIAASPSIPSNPAYPEGVVENRRVELSSPSSTLFAPIIHERFREYIVQRSQIVLRLPTLPAAVQRWRVHARHGQYMLGSRHGDGIPPPLLRLSLDSAALIQRAPFLSTRDSLACDLELWMSDGSTITATIYAPVERTMSKFERRRLSLVVFDFDRADFSPTNRELVERFILASVTPHSRIRITGSTDRLGEAAYNVQLSQARANEARRLIERVAPSARIEEVRGIGAAELFDNASPEGRYYCRTVTIVVETPLEESPR